MNITPVVKQLLIINILFFIGTQLVPVSNVYFALFSYQDSNFQYWQILTHMFMHGGIMHILFNMFALFSFGSALEHFWGGKKFLFFYISCGIGAALVQMGINYLELQHILENVKDFNLTDSALHQILNATVSDNTVYRPDLFEAELKPILENAGKLNMLNEDSFLSFFKAASSVQVPMVGASGAIYGLLVAYAFMFPNAELMLMFIPIPIKAKYFIPVLLMYDLYSGVTGSSIFGGSTGIAHFAHLGGALIGFLMMWYWKKNQFNNNRWN